jgi:hypothetical protein
MCCHKYLIFNLHNKNSNMASDIKKVYTGPKTEALWVQEILKENGIGSILKDPLQESLKAGWAYAAGDAVFVFVEEANLEQAKELLSDYFAKRKPLDDQD